MNPKSFCLHKERLSQVDRTRSIVKVREIFRQTHVEQSFPNELEPT